MPNQPIAAAPTPEPNANLGQGYVAGNPARRLRVLHAITLAVLALLTIISYTLAQSAMARQLEDVPLIELTASQRSGALLLGTAAMALPLASTDNALDSRILQFKAAMVEWQLRYRMLVQGNSPSGKLSTESHAQLLDDLETIQPSFGAIVEASSEILSLVENETVQTMDRFAVAESVDRLVLAEAEFVPKIDTIVGQHSRRARSRIRQFQVAALVLLVGSLAALFVAGFQVFRPATMLIESQFERVAESMRDADWARTKTEQLATTLAASEARKAAILDSSMDAIITMDHHGHVVDFNPAAQAMFGYTQAEAQGKELAALIIPPHFREGHRAGMAHFMATGEGPVLGKRVELEGLRSDGSQFPVELSINVVLADKHPLFTGFVRDITERLRQERDLKAARDAALESARLKAEFLANMSHEIRTPLNGVIGMTGFLLEGPLSAEQREYAELARKSGENLLVVINDVLDFSKIEAGRMELEEEEFSPREVVEDVVSLLAEPAQSKGLEIATIVLQDVPPVVSGDQGRIRQILINLISNAIKFTQFGEVIVGARVITDYPDKALIRFEVQDTGIGIPELSQPNLFTSFMQVDGSTSRRYGGTGLGLAISRQLVELMGGQIGVDSTEGVGSTFWFELPLEKVASDQAVVLSAPEFEGTRVLCVDDNATNRLILQLQLRSWNFESELAPDGPTALTYLQDSLDQGQPYRLAILDMQMPGMDGLELAKLIKAMPGYEDLKLVLLTSISRQGLATEARLAGVSAYLSKPVRQSHLFNTLQRVLGGMPEPEPKAEPDERRPMTMGPNRGRILIAEDNAVNQRVALHMLERLGYTADAVGNGREAIAALETVPYDLVLMDCQMPEMDGYTATAEIRKRQEQFGHIPVVAMTAMAMQGDRERCLAAGMDGYISKPIAFQELERILDRWIGPGSHPPKATAAQLSDAGAGATVREPEGADLSFMDNLRELEREAPGLVSEVLALFMEDVPVQLADLQEALLGGDAHQLMEVAHKLKGAAATMGMQRIAGLAADLEKRSRQGSLEGAEALVRDITSEYELVRPLLVSLQANGISV